MSGNQPSVPDRFVTVWAELQAIPAYDREDPNRFVFHQLQQEAIEIISDALRRSYRIAELVSRLKADITAQGVRTEVKS